MAVRPPNFIADFVSPILYFVPTNDIFSSILETMDAVNLRGAILIIGSLAWETEDKAINKELGLIRCRWREENLDMVNLKKVRCPIRYGRKSASRYNTYTMLFSNDTLINGTGLLVPLKDSVIITGNDFSNLFAQALLLAKAEGICKANEETLIKPWGTIAIHLSKSLEERHSEIYNNLKE